MASDRVVALMTLALCLLVGGAARAEGDAPPTAEVREQARVLAEGALRRYQIGDYAGAIGDFKRAYLLDPQPALLFNIAQAHRLSGDCDSARRFYANYLHDSPSAQNRASVEGKIVEMQHCIDERAAKATTTPPVAVVEPVTPTPPVVETPRRPRSRAFKIVALVSLGVGAALVAGGIVESVRAATASRKVGDLFAQGGTWDAAHQDLQSTGRTATNASIGLYVVGGAALAAGAVLTGLAFPPARHGRVQLGFSPTGASAGWSCEF